jgi:hypothetical protein
MSTLLLDKNLRGSGNNSEVQTLARARTLTVLGRLDPSRKTAVMQFLVEADLVQRVEGREPIIKLGQPPPPAAYTFAFSTIVPGSGTDLSGAYLLGTDLSGAYLSRADLREANLSTADLRGANLTLGGLSQADLSRADLGEATLNLASMSHANLSHANLRGAYLLGADLSRADLSRADLGEADLGEADLSGANLRYAKGTTKKQLEQAKSLEGATMPNGQKHEDWLKSKGSEKDRENSSPS